MINHNLLLYSLLDRKFSIEFNQKDWVVNFTEGDLFELNKKLMLSTTKYPIIWLQSGYTVSDYKLGSKVELQNCNFYLITKGDKNDLYKKRFETNYQNMLFPLLDKFKKVIAKSKGVSMLNDTINFVQFPFNDVTELTSNEGRKLATVPDVWDAIAINGINLRISKNCYPEFII